MSQLGRRYAKALSELARESGETQKVERDLREIAEAWASSEELRTAFELPEIAPEQRRAILEALASRMGLSTVVKHTLFLLSDRRRMRFLPDVVAAFRALAEAQAGRARVQVVTAVAFPDSFFADLQKTLEAALGQTIALDRNIDPSIIGGVVVRRGDRVLDGSLRTRLTELGDQLLQR